jgi:hypothetical protein
VNANENRDVPGHQSEKLPKEERCFCQASVEVLPQESIVSVAGFTRASQCTSLE